jgi:hypothetical protein
VEEVGDFPCLYVPEMTEDEEERLSLHRDLLKRYHASPFHIVLSSKKKEVERYSDKFKREDERQPLESVLHVHSGWLPMELRKPKPRSASTANHLADLRVRTTSNEDLLLGELSSAMPVALPLAHDENLASVQSIPSYPPSSFLSLLPPTMLTTPTVSSTSTEHAETPTTKRKRLQKGTEIEKPSTSKKPKVTQEEPTKTKKTKTPTKTTTETPKRKKTTTTKDTAKGTDKGAGKSKEKGKQKEQDKEQKQAVRLDFKNLTKHKVTELRQYCKAYGLTPKTRNKQGLIEAIVAHRASVSSSTTVSPPGSITETPVVRKRSRSSSIPTATSVVGSVSTLAPSTAASTSTTTSIPSILDIPIALAPEPVVFDAETAAPVPEENVEQVNVAEDQRRDEELTEEERLERQLSLLAPTDKITALELKELQARRQGIDDEEEEDQTRNVGGEEEDEEENDYNERYESDSEDGGKSDSENEAFF